MRIQFTKTAKAVIESKGAVRKAIFALVKKAGLSSSSICIVNCRQGSSEFYLVTPLGTLVATANFSSARRSYGLPINLPAGKNLAGHRVPCSMAP